MRVQETLSPLFEITAKYREQVTNALAGMAELARPITAVRIMGESQFVYWDRIDDQLINELIESSNPNKVRNLIASNIEEHIKEFLGSVITEEDIA